MVLKYGTDNRLWKPHQACSDACGRISCLFVVERRMWDGRDLRCGGWCIGRSIRATLPPSITTAASELYGFDSWCSILNLMTVTNLLGTIFSQQREVGEEETEGGGEPETTNIQTGWARGSIVGYLINNWIFFPRPFNHTGSPSGQTHRNK